MIQFQPLNGLIAAVFTPFDNQGEINTSIIAAYATRLKEQGVAGVFVNGSSGEGMMLSVDERKQLAEEWCKYGDSNFKIIIHVGSTSVKISQDLASHGQEIGADAIACMAPSFFSSSDVNIIIDYCRQVAESAPHLPFYYYHLPVITGAHIKVNQLLEKGSKLIPNLAGVKFTYTDFMDMHQCISLEGGKFDILHGHDEILINGLILGVKGAIGTTFNFMPEVYLDIMRAYNQTDFEAAKVFQMKSIKIVEIMLRYVNAIVGGKAILKLSGIDCGGCRTPLRNLTDEEQKRLEAELTQAGYFTMLKEYQQMRQ